MSKNNRREFFRVCFEYPLCTKLKIKFVGKQEYKSGKYTQICIQDLSAGGLKFFSHLDLPVSPDIIYLFQTTILEKDLAVNGRILRKEEREGIYQYGVKFEIGQEQGNLLALINSLAIQLKESRILKKCSFCLKNQITCLINKKAT